MQQVRQGGFQAEQLEDIVQTPDFRKRIKQLARFTINERLEGCFAVYQDTSLSELLAPTYEELSHTLSQRPSMYDAFKLFDPLTGEGIGIDIRPVINTPRGTLRNDIGVIVHSHPGGSKYRAPSATDLNTHQTHELINPGLVNGVLSIDRPNGPAALLAYRMSDYRQRQLGYVQVLNDYNTVPATLEAMENAGINTIRLDYDLRTGRLLTDPDTIADLYE